MRRRFHPRHVAIAAGLLLLQLQSAWSLPIITSVEVVDGADPAELPPQFTGQTFDHPNEGAGFSVPVFGEEAPMYNDRAHEWNGATTSMPLPDYLVGGEYIMFPNDDRDNDPYLVEVTLSAAAEVYLLIDNRLPDGVNTTPPGLDVAMLWVTEDGWEPVRNGLNRRANFEEPDEVGADEGGNATGPGGDIQQWSSVYHRRIPAGTFTLSTPENAGRNMYGVVVKPVPALPYVSASSGDLRGVVFDISDGNSTDLQAGSIRLAIDGTDVTSQLQVTDLGDVTRVRLQLDEPFASLSTHTAVLTFTDNATPPAELSETLEFAVEYYATLGAADAVPSASVDTAASGFTVRVVQARDTAAWPGADLPQNTQRGELQLAGLLRDPVSGQWLANLAVGGPNADKTFTVERINWNQELNEGGTSVEIGNFQTSSQPSFPDEPIPGIPGTDPESPGNLDNIAAEIIGYLELSPGLYRFGVNSDDGFRLTAGADPASPSNVVLGEFSGGRGAADSLFYVKVDAAGIYPVRLIWYEGGGGANVEFFSVHQPNPDAAASFLPINTRSDANAIKSYARASAALAPAAGVYPLAGSSGVPADARIQAILRSRGSEASAGSVQLTINGTAAAVTTTPLDSGLLVEHVPAGLWPSSSTNTAVLTFASAAGAASTVTWQFVVEDYSDYPVIPAAYAVPAASVNTTSSGFIVDEYQMWDGAAVTPVARTGFADNNSPEAAEQQIARGYLDPATDEPYVPFGAPGENPDGTHNIELINWNQQIANAGDFNGGNLYEDALIPGLAIDGDIAENDWIVAESVAYLELSKGRHRFGVNSDDGFKVSVSPNPRDVVGLQLGVFNTGRGAANTFFNFFVEEDGIYPVRLLWWEGTGGASVEFKSQDSVTLAQTLINDRSRPSGIKAYRLVTGTPIARVATASPSPGAINVAVDSPISVGLESLGNGTAQLRVNGADVTAERTTSGQITTLTYQPPQPFPSGSTVEVELVRGTTTSSWSFTVGAGAENLLTVAITAPANGATYPVGPTNLTLIAEANSIGGQVTRVEFFDGNSNKVGEATSAPYQTTWNVLPGRHSIRALVTDSRGLTAQSAPARFQVGVPLAVNFQAASAEVPEGYLADYGDVFEDRGNGESYGWDVDNTAEARDRNDARSPDERYDTFNHMQKPQPAGSLWEIEVPNGRYHVYAVAGEASNIDSVYNIQAEGVTVAAGTPTDAVRWFEGMVAVQVSDGRLTLSNGPGASNNKVCFVELYSLPPETESPAFAPPVIAGNTLTLTWTGGGTLESAPEVDGPYTTTGDSDGSYTETVTGEQKYFRVRR